MKNIFGKQVEGVDYATVESEEEKKMKLKTPWSLKKKLIVAGGAVAGIVVGALALMKKSKNDETDEEFDDEELDADEVETFESAETTDEVENESTDI